MNDAEVTLFGRLMCEPNYHEVNTANGNSNVINFQLSVSTSGKNENGNYIENIYDVSVWNKTNDFIKEHLKKGSKVYVKGSLVIKPYTSKYGDKETRMTNYVDGYALRII